MYTYITNIHTVHYITLHDMTLHYITYINIYIHVYIQLQISSNSQTWAVKSKPARHSLLTNLLEVKGGWWFMLKIGLRTPAVLISFSNRMRLQKLCS